MESNRTPSQELQAILDEFAGAKKDASLFVKEAAEHGDIVIGSFCQYAPMEIINAGGMHNVLLCGFNYDPPIPVGGNGIARQPLPADQIQLWEHPGGNLPLCLLFGLDRRGDHLRWQEEDV